MVREARERGHTEIRLAHNAVFATLHGEAGRTSDMAARAGITKQSMGEVVRELADLGILEVHPDPEDRRAKLVSYTDSRPRGGQGRDASISRISSRASSTSSARPTTKPRDACWRE